MSNSKRLSLRQDVELFLPALNREDAFVDVVRALCAAIEDAVQIPYSWEQLETGDAAQVLQPLVESLTEEKPVHHLLVSALLVLRYHFKDPDDRGVSQARAYACELLAWRVTLDLSRHERLDALLRELPSSDSNGDGVPNNDDHHDHQDDDHPDDNGHDAENAEERTSLLHRSAHHRAVTDEVSFIKRFTKNQMRKIRRGSFSSAIGNSAEEDPTAPFVGLNALEIAAVAEAKKFLSQNIVQRSINSIWYGDIMFWGSVSMHAERRPFYYYHRQDRGGAQTYGWISILRWRRARRRRETRQLVDPYCRLRVPLYQKSFETVFLLAFVGLYYAAMLEDNTTRPTTIEALLYVWIAAFTYEEVSSFFNSGMRFYMIDIWNLMDIGIIGITMTYMVLRLYGLARNDLNIVDLAFDVLSLLAIPLVPRTFSLLSLHPYFGILIPSLSQMCRDLAKFLVIVLVVYFGFASTFVLLAQDAFTAKEMFWLLIQVFNGSGYLGLDASGKISEAFGPSLMVVFVTMTNILLLPTLISLLTNSLTLVTNNSREEFLFQYSVLVLESCASKRLTYYLPPLNLIPLVLLRPLRLVLQASQVRSARIVLLKITHAPFVVLITVCESLSSRWQRDPDRWRSKQQQQPSEQTALGLRSSSLLSPPVRRRRWRRRHSRCSRSEGLVFLPHAATAAAGAAAADRARADDREQSTDIGPSPPQHEPVVVSSSSPISGSSRSSSLSLSNSPHPNAAGAAAVAPQLAKTGPEDDLVTVRELKHSLIQLLAQIERLEGKLAS